MRRFAIGRIVAEAMLIVTVIVLAIHHASPISRQYRLSDVIYRFSTNQKVVALTFDDGPHPKFTPQILKTLDKYHVKATFFMIGKDMLEHPAVVREVIRRGHAIGNHTYSHPHDIELDTRAQITYEIDKCEQVIERLTGRRTYLFRPPRGLVDGTVLQVANEKEYRIILWTVSADHHDALTPQMMAERVLQYIRPDGIILAHDGQYCSRIKDVEATPLIIKELVRRGYRFVTIPELIRTYDPDHPASGQVTKARYSPIPSGIHPNRP